MRKVIGAVALGAAVLAGPGLAGGKKTPSGDRPQAFETLVRCRAIADEKARLQCFDASAAAFEQAAERHEIVVIDRKQIRETKRTLFGLEIPRLKIFGGSADEGEDVREIEGVVTNASVNQGGQWVLRLEDGATWIQTDHNTVAVAPKRGTKVVIRRAALGSYMLRINGQPGVRAKRQL